MVDLWIDPTLYTARPATGPGQPEAEMRVYDLLEELDIPFIRIDHDATPSIEACLEVEKLLGIEICKNLFLCNAGRTNYYLLVMPGNKPFRTSVFSKLGGSPRLSFADEGSMETLLGLRPGSVSVLGLMNDREHRVRVAIDRDILKLGHIGCHPCVNTASLKIATEDILTKFLPHTGHQPVFVEL
jgi:Ala-tRNA(Pro) deacylase